MKQRILKSLKQFLHVDRFCLVFHPNCPSFFRRIHIPIINLFCILPQSLNRRLHIASLDSTNRLFKGTDKIDRLITTDCDKNSIRQSSIGKGILLTRWHRLDKSLCKFTNGGRCCFLLTTQFFEQVMYCYSRIAVHRRGIVLDNANHTSTGIILRGKIIYRRKVIILIVNAMCGDAVSDL